MSSSTKPGGGDQGSGSAPDVVDEASIQSFPCSDAPAFTTLHAGTPVPAHELPRARAVTRPRRHNWLLSAVGLLILSIGAALLVGARRRTEASGAGMQ